MHSSRMPTGRSLTICLSLLRGGGGPQRNQRKNQEKIKKKNWGVTPPPGPHTPQTTHPWGLSTPPALCEQNDKQV